MANLIDTIQAEGMFTTFTRAIKMSEIFVALREPGAYTVFAPTDAAFAQMKAEDLEDLFEDYDELSKLVKYHIVMGIYEASALLDVIFLKTMEGKGSPSDRPPPLDQLARGWKTVQMPAVMSLRIRLHQACWKALRSMARPSHGPT